eukprot:5459307-Pyramimonas_sp.AAC.1
MFGARRGAHVVALSSDGHNMTGGDGAGAVSRTEVNRLQRLLHTHPRVQEANRSAGMGIYPAQEPIAAQTRVYREFREPIAAQGCKYTRRGSQS